MRVDKLSVPMLRERPLLTLLCRMISFCSGIALALSHWNSDSIFVALLEKLHGTLAQPFTDLHRHTNSISFIVFVDYVVHRARGTQGSQSTISRPPIKWSWPLPPLRVEGGGISIFDYFLETSRFFETWEIFLAKGFTPCRKLVTPPAFSPAAGIDPEVWCGPTAFTKPFNEGLCTRASYFRGVEEVYVPLLRETHFRLSCTSAHLRLVLNRSNLIPLSSDWNPVEPLEQLNGAPAHLLCGIMARRKMYWMWIKAFRFFEEETYGIRLNELKLWALSGQILNHYPKSSTIPKYSARNKIVQSSQIII